jgi:glycosyltransferase involved in cell wall biosynthesis
MLQSLTTKSGSDKSMPLVSIGLPTYGRTTTLSRILSQLTTQTYKNIEIVVTENCHPNIDGYEIALDAANCDERIKVFRQARNIGPIANHDFAKDKSIADFFMWIGDDDELDSRYVEECMKVISTDPSVSLVGGIGHRFLEGEWWYDYSCFTTLGMSTKVRLNEISKYAFGQHWLFEHYFYGVFRTNQAAPLLSRDPKSILFHFFCLAEAGDIVHCPSAIMTKHTTQNELNNHANNVAYRRIPTLERLRGRNWDNLQQCVPIYLQMLRVVTLSTRLSLLDKVDLATRISLRFLKGPVIKEVALYLPAFLNPFKFVRSVRSRLKRILISIYHLCVQ